MKVMMHHYNVILCMIISTLCYATELQFSIIHRAPKNEWRDFLGYTIASPIGISACAMTNSEGIARAARLGCDILTYKTIRCHAQAAHPQPNIVCIDRSLPLTYDDIGKTIVACDKNRSVCTTDISFANSFGNNSMDPEFTKSDIAKAKQSLLEGQVLIVSIFGNTVDEWIQTAQLAVEGGADIIEVNFSCPNLNTNNEPIYLRPDDVFYITHAIVQSIPAHIPLIIKCGVFTDHTLMRDMLVAAAHAGAQGICGINSVPMKVIDSDGAPFFGTRIMAGVSGAAIRQLALDFISTASMIIRDENLNLVLVGVGGITMARHFSQFLGLGATIALSATGMMHNPCLAAEYHEQIYCESNSVRERKEKLANKLFDMGVIKFGDFIFKSGIRSNNYVDMRLAISDPDVLQALALFLKDIQQECGATVVCAVPDAAVPVTTALSVITGIPMIMARKQAKDHGTRKMIEGIYAPGQECLIIEDIITTGSSILETINTVETAGLQVKDVVVLVDRQQGGKENIINHGYRLHAVFTLQELMLFLLKRFNKISQNIIDTIQLCG
jgi:orotate phosphoribosyltransferase